MPPESRPEPRDRTRPTPDPIAGSRGGVPPGAVAAAGRGREHRPQTALTPGAEA